MLKTRKEIFEWLLKKQGGFYDELVDKIGAEMAKDLEVLGYIHKGYAISTNEAGISWELTERGKRMAELIVKNTERGRRMAEPIVKNKKSEKKYSLIDILKKILF